MGNCVGAKLRGHETSKKYLPTLDYGNKVVKEASKREKRRCDYAQDKSRLFFMEF